MHTASRRMGELVEEVIFKCIFIYLIAYCAFSYNIARSWQHIAIRDVNEARMLRERERERDQ